MFKPKGKGIGLMIAVGAPGGHKMPPPPGRADLLDREEGDEPESKDEDEGEDSKSPLAPLAKHFGVDLDVVHAIAREVFNMAGEKLCGGYDDQKSDEEMYGGDEAGAGEYEQ